METKPEDTPASPERTHRMIKRYSNRKLYDTKDSRYVTLLQIAELVRAGEDVQIIDNTTKGDLTEVTLAQIIYEEQKAQTRSVPLQTLRDLIHQRTEKVLENLREGPIGRLIPGGEKKVETTAAPQTEAPEPPKTDGAKTPTLVEQAKFTIEDWQQRIDERVRAVLPSGNPWEQVQHEVKRLGQRLDDMERYIKGRVSGEGKEPAKEEDPVDPTKPAGKSP